MEYVNLKGMTWKEAGVRVKEVRVAILPLGPTEQHGYRMIIDTDSIVTGHAAGLLAKTTDCAVLPVLNYGQVWSAKDFLVIISLNEETYVSVIRDIVMSPEKKRKDIILFSGHWGNVALCKLVVRELLDECGFRNVYYLSYMDSKKNGERAIETELWDGSGLRAAEIETPILPHICPDSAEMEKAIYKYPEISPDADIRPIPWAEFAESEILGDVSKMTTEKEKRLLDNWMRRMYRLVAGNTHS